MAIASRHYVLTSERLLSVNEFFSCSDTIVVAITGQTDIILESVPVSNGGVGNLFSQKPQLIELVRILGHCTFENMFFNRLQEIIQSFLVIGPIFLFFASGASRCNFNESVEREFFLKRILTLRIKLVDHDLHGCIVYKFYCLQNISQLVLSFFQNLLNVFERLASYECQVTVRRVNRTQNCAFSDDSERTFSSNE
jgi:hypothetical protein